MLIVSAAILISLSAGTVKYIFEGDEGKVKRVIYAAKGLIEKEKPFGLTGLISVHYYDDFDNDRRALLLIAKDFFDSCESIAVRIDNIDVKVEDKDAVAAVDAAAYWQENGAKDILYDVYKLKALFRKEEGGWKLIKLEFLEPEDNALLNSRTG